METSEIIDLLYYTPTEYAPKLAMIGFIIGALVTFAIGLGKYYGNDKDQARAGQPKAAYGLSYLTLNIGVVVVTVLAAIIAPGMYFDGAVGVGVEQDYYLLGIVSASIVALGGDKLFRTFLEGARDRSKAKEARTETKTE